MTAEGLRRFSSVLTVSGARYVFILEGTNDALFFSPGTILTNLTSMVDQALALNVVPVLGTLTPDSRYAKPIAEINRRIRELAMARNILLADHDTAVGSNWPQLTSDGLHPNASGYAVLAQSWAQSFSNLGDINGDGMLNLVDTILALQIVSGKILSEPINLDADVDGDGKIGMSEAIRTLHVIQLWQ